LEQVDQDDRVAFITFYPANAGFEGPVAMVRKPCRTEAPATMASMTVSPQSEAFNLSPRTDTNRRSTNT